MTSGSARTTRRRIWRARFILPPLNTRTGTRWTSEADADEHSDRGVLLHPQDARRAINAPQAT